MSVTDLSSRIRTPLSFVPDLCNNPSRYLPSQTLQSQQNDPPVAASSQNQPAAWATHSTSIGVILNGTYSTCSFSHLSLFPPRSGRCWHITVYLSGFWTAASGKNGKTNTTMLPCSSSHCWCSGFYTPWYLTSVSCNQPLLESLLEQRIMLLLSQLQYLGLCWILPFGGYGTCGKTKDQLELSRKRMRVCNTEAHF